MGQAEVWYFGIFGEGRHVAIYLCLDIMATFRLRLVEDIFDRHECMNDVKKLSNWGHWNRNRNVDVKSDNFGVWKRPFDS